MTVWDVRYTRQFDDQLMELPDRDYESVEHSIGLQSRPAM